MATSISLKDGLGLSQTPKAGQNVPVSGIALLKLRKLFVFGRDIFVAPGGFLQKIDGMAWGLPTSTMAHEVSKTDRRRFS
jgi:hypothetical protein